MKGFVPTPAPVVDLMVEKLFRSHPPTPDACVLDPGCGPGAFIQGVIRWCEVQRCPPPRIVGIESNSLHVAVATRRFVGCDRVEIRAGDFLEPIRERFDYIIGNPPYVPITDLSTEEREAYRGAFRTARGRFDLYLLFYEQALGLLKPGGRLVFITPEKFLYVRTAAPLRALLRRQCVEELHFLDEETFGGLVTYPLVTTVVASEQSPTVSILHRGGRKTSVLAADLDATTSWLPAVLGSNGDHQSRHLSLEDVCTRISCGVATGADAVYVVRDDELNDGLRGYAHPTIAGRQITEGEPLNVQDCLLVPYTDHGDLLPEKKLGELGRYLLDEIRRARLLERTCVRRKPWYAFHENPPLTDMLQPKLLCKDITPEPFFIADHRGDIVPRHSVYYLVPRDSELLGDLADYLNSRTAREWLHRHCQRASKGYLRLQSHVLKRLPLPSRFALFRRAAVSSAQLEADLA